LIHDRLAELHLVNVSKVLLVDDEPDIRRIGHLSLERVGKWQVLLADSGPRALELAATECPDVILLDVMMPGMDGLTTLTRLKADARTAGIPVLIMTAKVRPRELEEYTRHGATGVIHKPFDPLTLPDEVKRALGIP
jgi:CheY-like chemotaxis protein